MASAPPHRARSSASAMPTIRQTLSRPVKPPQIATASYAAKLLSVVDRFPETRGMGVCIVDGRRRQDIRQWRPGQPFLVVQLHASKAVSRVPAAAAPVAQIDLTKEWINLGLNLGGATLSWIGVAGSAALAPETGGATGVAAVVLWSGALASSAQTGNSVVRLWKIYNGESRWVTEKDHDAVYLAVNQGLDLVGLVGAGLAFKETVVTARALGRAGSSWRVGLGTLSRQQRAAITRELALQGARRIAAKRINFVLQAKLLDAFAATYGTSVSAYNGVAHDVAVWIVSPKGSR